MDIYHGPDQGHADAYMIQGTESNPQYTGLLPEQFQAMYSEATPEFVADQGMYYPTATNYGYFYPGYESPGDWDDHHRVFGVDGLDMQYPGAQTESLPYVYYTPSYGYTQSSYNPYNPYIPGAMMGVDGPLVGPQDYYTIPTYDGGVSSPAFFPMPVQSRSDVIANSSTDPFIDTYGPAAKRGDGPGLKHNISSTSQPSTPAPIGPASSQTKSFTRVHEANRSSGRATKQPIINGGVTSASFSKEASSQVLQGSGAQPIDNLHGKQYPIRNPFRVSPSTVDGSSSFGSTASTRAVVDKVRPKFFYEKVNEKNVKGSPDVLAEQSPVSKVNKSKNQLIVKAFTTRAGDVDEKGYITIDTEQYNRDDFQVDFANAKFFVIKSYSEDDVHKSIKYNVWSSTPNGNKKLNSAYEDAQRIGGCPIFLFFSVNASGQFCGVAEMTGPVDFHRDMDFWQQDKWTGSFPVKWHIIKDLPNPNFRHVLLENNENKPVTNSRDTQEIPYKKGIEMLKIFKSYSSRTSLLDDFLYYENRQKILQEEKARLLIKNYGSSFIVPVLDPPRKLHSILDLSSSEDEKAVKRNGSDISKRTVPGEQVLSEVDTKADRRSGKLESDGEASVDALQIGSLTISEKQSQLVRSTAAATSASSSTTTATSAASSTVTSGASSTATATSAASSTATATSASSVTATYVSASVTASPAASATASPVATTTSVDVVAVGSMPVKVNGLAESSGFLTVGTIPLDPRALQHDEACLSGKNVPMKG